MKNLVFVLLSSLFLFLIGCSESDDVIPCAEEIDIPAISPLESSYEMLPYLEDTTSLSGAVAHTIVFVSENSSETLRYRAQPVSPELESSIVCFVECPTNETQTVLVTHNLPYKFIELTALTEFGSPIVINRPLGILRMQVESFEDFATIEPEGSADVLKITRFVETSPGVFNFRDVFMKVLNERNFPGAVDKEDLEVINAFELFGQTYDNVYLQENTDLATSIYYQQENGILKMIDSNGDVWLREGL